MDINALTNTLKSGGGIVSPISSSASDLTSQLSSLLTSADPTIVALANSMQSTITSANSAVSAILSSITTSLPLLKAADNLTAKLAASQGTPLPLGPTSSFTDAFGPLTVTGTQLGSIQSALTPTILAELQAGNTTNLASVSGAVTSASSSIDSSVTSSNAGMSDGINTVKSFAFAKFSSMQHPPHVQAVLDQVVPSSNKVPYENSLADATLVKTAAPTVGVSRIPASPDASTTETQPHTDMSLWNANAQRIGYTGTYPFYDFKDEYFNYADGLSKAVQDTYQPLVDATAACTTWRDANYPNYAALKQAAIDNPSNSQAQSDYAAAKQACIDGGCSDYNTKKAAYDAGRNNIIRLRSQFNAWCRNNFNDIVPGPTW